MYDNDSDAHSEGKWPVEVLVIVGEEGGMIAINRYANARLGSDTLGVGPRVYAGCLGRRQ